MESNKKRVYCFGGKTAEGNGTMRELLGGKGANLAEMCTLNIPVPAGFTITTECCTEYYELGGGFNEALKAEVAESLKKTEATMGMVFGDKENPLLVSCPRKILKHTFYITFFSILFISHIPPATS